MKDNGGENRRLLPWSGTIDYPDNADQSDVERRKRAVIFAYDEEHAKEMTYLFLPPMRDSERFKGFREGCEPNERRLGEHPGVYVHFPRRGRYAYERLERWFIRPQPFSKNTQRKVGITIGATYNGSDEARKVETLTGDPAALEALGLFQTGSDLKVHYQTGDGKRGQCSVRDFHKWRDREDATIGELHLKLITTLKLGDRTLLEAACETLAKAKDADGIGDVANAVEVGELRGLFETKGGKAEGLRGFIGSLRHMALIALEDELPPEGAAVPNDLAIWMTGKGWCHWSQWKDDMILHIKPAEGWEDKDLDYIEPGIRKKFIAKRK